MTRPGLARERTALAWTRTALATCALAALLIKLAIDHDRPLEAVAGGVALLQALAIWRLQPAQTRDRGGEPWRIFIAAAATGVTVVLASISVFT
jgi:uncharacterized membrane protein YidH (DUF202 family)